MKYILSSLFIILVLISGTCQCRARQAATSIEENRPDGIRPSLATSVAAALFGLKKKSLVVVDVRLLQDFEQYHIPGSLNIPLYALKTKAFLKSKPVVLVNQGFHITPLVRACDALNQSGFRATILAGGLAAWEAAGADLVGDPFARAALRRITPQHLYLERDNPHIRIVADADTVVQDGFASKVQRLPGLEKQAVIPALKKIMGARASDPFACLVVVCPTGGRNALIQRNLTSAGLSGIFFLEGGAKAYAAYLDGLRLARRPKPQRMLRTGGCPACAAGQ